MSNYLPQPIAESEHATTLQSSYGAMHDTVGATIACTTSYAGVITMLTGVVKGTGFVTFTSDDVNGDYLEIGASGAGTYAINYSLTATGVTAYVYGAGVYIDGSLQSDTVAQREFLTATLTGCMAGGTIVALTAGQKIRLKVVCSDAGPHNLIIVAVNLWINRIAP